MPIAETILRTILTGSDESASKAIRGAAGEAQGAQKHFAGLGKVAAGVFAGGALVEGAQKVGEFLKGSVEAAVQDQTANAILERQLKNTTGATGEQVKATEEWLTKTAEATGIAKGDLTPTLTRLATVTGSVGKAQKLTTLAMNVAAGTHQKLTSITGAFVRAQNGAVSGLSRLGIATKNADGTTKTFGQVQKELASQFKGDSAAAADTAAGKMQRLSVTWEEMKVQVGDKLLPVLTSLSGWVIDDAIPALSSFGGWVQKNEGWLKPLAAVVAGMVVTFVLYNTALKASAKAQSIWALLMGDSAAASEAATVATEEQTAAQGELDAAMDANPIGLIVVALGALAAGLIYAYKHSATFRAIVQGALHAVSVAAGVMGHYFGVAAHAADVAMKGIQTGVSNAVNFVKNHWKLILAILTGPFGAATIFVISHWHQIEDAAGNVISGIHDGLNKLVGWVAAMPRRIGSAASGMFGGIEGAFRSAIDWIIDKWNGLSFSIPGVNTHIPGVGTVGGFTLSTPNIPRLARGGIVRARPGGSLILAGEGGRDEAVVPLGRGSSGASQAPVQIIIQGALDPIATGRQVQQVLKRYQRLTGVSLDLA